MLNISPFKIKEQYLLQGRTIFSSAQIMAFPKLQEHPVVHIGLSSNLTTTRSIYT